MTRLQRSRALRWLCTLAAAVALIIMLFPQIALWLPSLYSGRGL